MSQMDKVGSEVEIVLGNSNPRFSGVTSSMLQVLSHLNKMTRVAVMGKHHLPSEALCLSFLKACKLCRKTLPDGNPRVFHARRNNEMLQAVLMKKLLGAKIKIAFTSTAQRDRTWITRWLIREADGVITTNNAANAYIQGGADTIIPHGIDLSRYQPAEDRMAAWKELGYPGKYGIGIFGRIRHQKGLDVFVNALMPLMKKHPDFTAVVCGETTKDHKKYEDDLKSEINKAGLQDRFLFLGKQDFSDLPKLFRSMHIVAALSRNEGFGLTVLEAMASGTAVITSEAGAWKDLVRHGKDGYTVPCGDIDATSRQLDLMMSDLPALEEMGKAGRARAESNYTIEREALAIYDYLVSLTKR